MIWNNERAFAGYDQWKTASPFDEMDDEVDFMVVGLNNALLEHSTERNQDCWPVCSFGGKDADLDRTGCCGIEKWGAVNVESFTLTVGGHKTLGDPTHECEWVLTEDEEEAWSEMAHSIVCHTTDYSGEWTGDEWIFSMRKDFEVGWIYDKDDAPDFDATAKIVYDTAQELLKPFHADMADMDDELERLYQTIRKAKEAPNG